MATATAPAEDAVAGYAPHEHRPLAAYAGLTAAFGATLGGALVALRAAGRELPESLSPGDLALAGIATHKVSRLLAKDKVTSFIRAPFTRYQEPAGHGELEEAPRGSGAQYAIGELLVCPYCLGFWIASAFSFGLVFAPRLTRFIAATLSAVTASDFLQVAYKTAEERGLKGS
jgi:hypothetical protein